MKAVKRSAKIAAAATGASERQVFVASTGVIGEPLDASKFEGVLDRLAKEARPDRWQEAARAIMTTDTYPKLATRKATIAGVEVTITLPVSTMDPDGAEFAALPEVETAAAPQATASAVITTRRAGCTA